MKIINVSQTNDRIAWLDLRRGVITSTKAKTVAPPKRGGITPQGIYELLAEKIAIPKDGEPERDRGLRLEDSAILRTKEKYMLNLNTDPGMWLTDDGKLAVSPDAAEVGNNPTYAVEAKCLDSKNHLQGILTDFSNKKRPDYNPLDGLKISTSDFTAQVIQYFVVNPSLERLYFTLYDDRQALDNVVHYVIVINRSHVEEYTEGQEAYERAALERVDDMIKTLKSIK